MPARHTELYELLEISPDADEDAIKKAYRRLAVKYHPDKNPGDKEAEEKFKKLSHAYEILGNKEKRQIYDQYGEDAANGNGGGGGFSGDPFDIFNQFFGGGGGGFESFFGGGRRRDPNGPQEGADLRYNLGITLDEAFKGVTKKIEFNRPGLCTACGGSGCADGTKPERCDRCKGSGQVGVSQGFFTMMHECPVCHGTGRKIAHKCAKCNGAGKVSVHRAIEVHIPAGIDTGNRMRVTGEGEPGLRGGSDGDLYIMIQVRPDKRFQREDEDIYAEYHIPFPVAALGGTVTIPTVHGDSELTIPAGTQNGDVLTLKGKGMPVRQRQGVFGNHHVKLTIDVPRKLNDAQREALKAYAAAFQTDGGGAKNNGAEPNFTVNADNDPSFFQKLKDKVGL